MDSCSYWAAGHITAFFKIADSSNDLLYKGSCGAGFNINRGVITEVTNAPKNIPKHRVYFNNELQINETHGITDFIIKEFESLSGHLLPHLDFKYTFQAPIGSGYGTSAAGALTTAFAINEFLELHIPNLKLWQIAHKAEIINKTGLGDILGLYANSMFELRSKEGAPGIGKVISLKFSINDYDLYTLALGPLSKKNILSDPVKRKKIIDKGTEVLEIFSGTPTFDNFCNLSLEFTKVVDLLPKNLLKILFDVKSPIRCSQIMLGESLYFFVPKNIPLPKFNNFFPIKEHLTETTLQRII